MGCLRPPKNFRQEALRQSEEGEMTSQLEWTFPSAQVCEIKGLNDSGVETFKGDTISSLAREICQNSLDAAHGSGAEKPSVEVEFVRFAMAKNDFPDRAGFKDAVDRAKRFHAHDEQVKSFIEELEEAFAAEEIPCLRISDHHTTGLKGVQIDDRTKPSAWRSLVFSSGVSNKDGMSGGSFGIGKFAAFACSKFRTAFYATKTDDGYEGIQGVARLVSFTTEDEETALGTGYCGQGDSQPIREWGSLDTNYERKNPGTDIYIPAFVGGENFREDIIRSALDGFLYAIYTRQLVVRIDDGSENQIVVLDRAWLEKAYKAKDPLFDSVYHTYEALKQPEEKWKEKDFAERGKIRLSVIANEKDLDKRIAMVRQPGMQIFKKDHFRSHISFTGILIVEGALNCELKRFENPQHTQWEKKRDIGNAGLLEEIYKFCRETVSEITRDDLGEQLDSGLGDVLPDMSDEGEKRLEEVLDVKAKKMLVAPEKPIKRKRRAGKPTRGGTKSDHPSGSDKHETERDNRTVQDNGRGGNRKVMRRDVGCLAFRSICNDKARGAYKLKVIPEKDVESGSVAVIAVAEIKDYPAPVKSARLEDGTELKVEGNEISGFKFEKKRPLKIDLELDYSDYLSLEVACYEYK